MIAVHAWMEAYRKAVCRTFGERVLFIGLQGSYGRNEATDQSDIDVVLILDHVNFCDLKRYRAVIRGLSHADFVCGFVSGREELAGWSRYDLAMLYLDTVPWMGDLSTLIPPPTARDAAQAVHIGACNLYHACSHNFLHAGRVSTLRELYKSAFFILRAKYYVENGKYVASRQEMSRCVSGEDARVLQAAMNPEVVGDTSFQQDTERLLSWSRTLICTFGAGEL